MLSRLLFAVHVNHLEEASRESTLLASASSHTIPCERGSTGGQGEGCGRAAAPAREDEEGSFTPCHRGASPAAASAPGGSRPGISIQHLSRLSPGAVRRRAQHRPAMPSVHTRARVALCSSRAAVQAQPGQRESPKWALRFPLMPRPLLPALAIHST